MRSAYLTPTRRRADAMRSIAPRIGLLTLIGISLALAAVSLLLPLHGLSVIAYDPMVWLIWGREVAHLDLQTVSGPSWKPLPVMFTTAFSLFGDHAAPSLWLVVGRAGGVLGLIAAYRVASRLGGWVAGVLAVAALMLQSDFLLNAVRGDSDALTVAMILVGVDAHLSGHRYGALAAAAAVALMRPESWLFAGAYGLWLLYDARGTERQRQTLLVVLGAAVLVLALWFIPEKLASGHFLRGAQRAREPVAGSPAQAAFPFLAVFTNSIKVLPWPVYVGAAVAVLVAVVRLVRERVVTVPLILAGASTIYMLIVAALAQIGFTGNPRYVIPPSSLLAVLAGIGFVLAGRFLVERYRRRVALVAGAVLLAAAAPAVAAQSHRLYNRTQRLRVVARQYAELPSVIAAGGGARALARCGGIATGPYQTPIVAWLLHVPQHYVALDAQVPGVVIAPYYTTKLVNDPRFPTAIKRGRWIVLTTCG